MDDRHEIDENDHNVIGIWVPIYIGDFRRDTDSQPLVFKAMYLNLLMKMWESNSGQLDNIEAKLQRYSGATDAEWTEHWPDMSRLFFVMDGNLNHNGLRKARDKAVKVRQSRKAASVVANEKRWADYHKRQEQARRAEQGRVVRLIDGDGSAI